MPWFWSSSPSIDDNREPKTTAAPVSGRSFLSPDVLLPTTVLTTLLVGSSFIYRTRLRRIPNARAIPESFLRRRSLWGKVVSVGDADNFRLYHMPGGMLAGWNVFRKIPTSRKELMEQTVHVRVAGIDAPEGAHFGRPAQPYSAQSLEEMKNIVDGKLVRVYVYRKDQYERVVASAHIRRFGIPGLPIGWTTDVGKEMLRRGAAGIYEAKWGVEFGGEEREAAYRKAEAKAKSSRLGMWSGHESSTGLGAIRSWFKRDSSVPQSTYESPREYKTRMKKLEEAGELNQAPPAKQNGKG